MNGLKKSPAVSFRKAARLYRKSDARGNDYLSLLGRTVGNNRSKRFETMLEYHWQKTQCLHRQ